MSYKLWFISKNNSPIDVLEDFIQANDRLNLLKENNPSISYKLYEISILELGNYSKELTLAESKGIVII